MIDFEAEMERIALKVVDKRLAEEQAKAVEQLLTTDEAAAVAKVTPNTIRRWMRDGTLAASRAGRLPRFRRGDLDAAMRKMATTRRKVSSNDNASVDRLVEQRMARKAK